MNGPFLLAHSEAGRTSHASADGLIADVKKNQSRVRWILQTRAHADHMNLRDRNVIGPAREQFHRPALALP